MRNTMWGEEVLYSTASGFSVHFGAPSLWLRPELKPPPKSCQNHDRPYSAGLTSVPVVAAGFALPSTIRTDQIEPS
jgi:hypothetical protein